MCIDGWVILICGIDSKNRMLKKAPKDLVPYLDHQYWCRQCDTFRSVHTRRREEWFSCCYIPLYPVRRRDPYVACGVCKAPVDLQYVEKRCSRCGSGVRGHYCSICGLEQV